MKNKKLNKILIGGLMALILTISISAQSVKAVTDPPIGGAPTPIEVILPTPLGTDPPIGG